VNVGVDQVRASKIRCLEIGSGETRVVQPGAAQVSADEAGFGQVGLAQVASLEAAMVEGDADQPLTMPAIAAAVPRSIRTSVAIVGSTRIMPLPVCSSSWRSTRFRLVCPVGNDTGKFAPSGLQVMTPDLVMASSSDAHEHVDGSRALFTATACYYAAAVLEEGRLKGGRGGNGISVSGRQSCRCSPRVPVDLSN
jgi:hypothetical protein